MADEDGALVDALDALLRDGARRTALSSAGRRGVATGFTERHMAGAVERLLLERGADDRESDVESVTP